MVFCAGKYKKRMRKEKNQHDSKNGQDGKHQSLIRTSPCMTNILINYSREVTKLYPFSLCNKVHPEEKNQNKDFKVNSYMS